MQRLLVMADFYRFFLNTWKLRPDTQPLRPELLDVLTIKERLELKEALQKCREDYPNFYTTFDEKRNDEIIYEYQNLKIANIET